MDTHNAFDPAARRDGFRGREPAIAAQAAELKRRLDAQRRGVMRVAGQMHRAAGGLAKSMRASIARTARQRGPGVTRNPSSVDGRIVA